MIIRYFYVTYIFFLYLVERSFGTSLPNTTIQYFSLQVVRWGRSVYANIQKFIQFQLTVNVTALIINVVAAISAGDVPLNAVQVNALSKFLNLNTEGKNQSEEWHLSWEILQKIGLNSEITGDGGRSNLYIKG